MLLFRKNDSLSFILTSLHSLNIDCFHILFHVASDDLMTHALVGSIQAENFSENTAPNLNRKASANSMVADQSLDQRR
jgi:hypothetical protein